MQNTATTYNPTVDTEYVSRLREQKRAEQLAEERLEEMRQDVQSRNMDEVSGAKRIRGAAKAGLKKMGKKQAVKKIEEKIGQKILCGMPFVSALYGAYAFFVNISTSDKKKKVNFGLLDWLLLIVSNIEIIIFVIAGLAIIVMIVDFMDAGVFDKLGMIYEGILGFGWAGIDALIKLF